LSEPFIVGCVHESQEESGMEVVVNLGLPPCSEHFHVPPTLEGRRPLQKVVGWHSASHSVQLSRDLPEILLKQKLHLEFLDFFAFEVWAGQNHFLMRAPLPMPLHSSLLCDTRLHFSHFSGLVPMSNTS
jgi:hypothetical protein